MPSIHDIPALEREFRRRGADPQALRALRRAFYKRRQDRESALAEVPRVQLARLPDDIEFHSLELDSRHDSERDGASKLIFRTRRGHRIESVVLRINTGRTALCVSSQVGCAANCSFCATGKMGLAVNLEPSEILDQVVQVNRILLGEGRRLRNVVFMGMGEPFHNEDHLHEALEVLRSPRCFDHPEKLILVSTVGIPDAMLRFARRFRRARLALSLHSARQSTRERLLPLSRRHSLTDLREALIEVAAIQDQRTMIEYLMLDGQTDTDEEWQALVDFLRDVPSRINLIPYNPIAGAPELRPTPRPRLIRFADRLKNHGFEVTVRYSLGADIAAACGQLVREENRNVARARGSVEG